MTTAGLRRTALPYRALSARRAGTRILRRDVNPVAPYVDTDAGHAHALAPKPVAVVRPVVIDVHPGVGFARAFAAVALHRLRVRAELAMRNEHAIAAV